MVWPTLGSRTAKQQLFAYREAPQDSLGFALFELLYKRRVKGLLRILRQLWTRKQADPEVRTTYQYVVDQRNRLEETWEMAHEKLRKHRVIQKRQFDYRAKDRTFRHGDLVLIFLPTSDNKMLMQWRGPFKVLKRVEDEFGYAFCFGADFDHRRQ